MGWHVGRTAVLGEGHGTWGGGVVRVKSLPEGEKLLKV